jgi:hypothetical protein
MRGGVMPHSMGRMPMQRGPMMNSPSAFGRFGDRNFNRNDRFGRFNRFNDGRFSRFNRFHRFNRFNHFNHFNDVVFIGNFGFPWWWGWGWGPSWGSGWGYPYGYYGGYNYGGYGSGYGYGDSSRSRVAELQRRLLPWRHRWNHGACDSECDSGLRARSWIRRLILFLPANWLGPGGGNVLRLNTRRAVTNALSFPSGAQRELLRFYKHESNN